MAEDGQRICILCGGEKFYTTFADSSITTTSAEDLNPDGVHYSTTTRIVILSCSQCRLAYRKEQLPAKGTLISQEDRSYGANEKTVRKLLSNVPDTVASPELGHQEIEEISQFIQPPGVFVNVGCDSADILETAKLWGWQSAGVELLNSVVSKENGQLTGKKTTTLHDVKECDILRLEGSLERAEDPITHLKQTTERLSKNGLLIISTPDCRGWDYPLYGQGVSLWSIDPPFWFFTPETLTRLVIRCGYRILKVSTYEIPHAFTADVFPEDTTYINIMRILASNRAYIAHKSRYIRVIARRDYKRVFDPMKMRSAIYKDAEGLVGAEEVFDVTVE